MPALGPRHGTNSDRTTVASIAMVNSSGRKRENALIDRLHIKKPLLPVTMMSTQRLIVKLDHSDYCNHET